MTTSNILLDMELKYNQFTKTEKKIADFVKNHVNQVLFMSITDLAEACEVADASVHRFCRTLGMKGYQEFKMKLSLSITPEQEEEKGEPDGDFQTDSMEYTLDQVLESHISALKETRMILNMDEVKKAVDMLEEADQVYFFGVGDSMLTAMEARNKFIRITPKVRCMNDTHMQAMSASMMNEKDLLVIISYSGATKDNIHVAEIARQAGAKVLGITRFLKSPLTGYTDTILLCGSREGPLEGGSMGVKLSQLYIIDILFREFYRRNQQISKENKHKTSKAVVEKLF